MKTLMCSIWSPCLDLQFLEQFFLPNNTIEAVEITPPWISVKFYVKPSQTLLRNPPHVKDIFLGWSPISSWSWSQISILMQHFRIVNNSFPVPTSNQEVVEDLKVFDNKATGLIVLGTTDWTFYGENNINTSLGTSQEGDLLRETSVNQTKLLSALPGMETLNCLVIHSASSVFSSFPSVLQQYKWPELRYLELYVKNFNLTLILALNKTAPKLTFLKLHVTPEEIPDILWMFDWKSLPRRIGVIVFQSYSGPVRLPMDLISSKKTPPINLHIEVEECDMDMSGNGLTSLGYIQFVLEYGCLCINLSHNNFKSVSLFSRFQPSSLMENIEMCVLDLSYNQLCGDDSDFLMLTYLHELYLDHNSYTRLPTYRVGNHTYSIKGLQQLTILDLSHNSIHITMDDYNDGTLAVSRDLSSPTIRELYLSHNYIQTIPKFIYTCTSLTHVDLSYNRIDVTMDNDNDGPSPRTSSPIRELNLSHNQIHDIPKFIYTCTSLTYVDLSYNGIEELSLVYSEEIFKMSNSSHLKILDLSWNNIHTIHFGVFKYLKNLNELTKLNLNNNNLQQIPDDVDQMTNLTTTLDLTKNCLVELPLSIQNINNLEIGITGNSFRCDCHTFWMTGWLQNTEQVKNPKEIICFSGKGQGKRMIDLHIDDVGCNDPLIHALIGLAVTVVLTATVITVIYRYRGYIKIWLYTRFHFHPWDQIRENLEEKKYDAFVSHYHEDWDWVLATLMPKLEDECGFRLCVHDRDFDLGLQIKDNITHAIQSSRRTIVVLTPEYAKSFWCNQEFLEAKQKAFNERANFIIVVLLRPVEHKDLDMTLKLYMDTNTYTNVNDEWFWKKLLYAMPDIPIDKLKGQQNQGEVENNDDPNDDDFAGDLSASGMITQRCNVQLLNADVGELNQRDNEGMLDQKSDDVQLNQEDDNGLLHKREDEGLLNQRNDVGMLNQRGDVAHMNQGECAGMWNQADYLRLWNQWAALALLNQRGDVGLLNQRGDVGFLNQGGDIGLLNQRGDVGLLNQKGDGGLMNQRDDPNDTELVAMEGQGAGNNQNNGMCSIERFVMDTTTV